MARGFVVTPNGGSALTLVPQPGSIKIGYEPNDVGGDGAPHCRNGCAIVASCKVTVLRTTATYAALVGLMNVTTKPTDHTVVVTPLIEANAKTINDASVSVSFEGDGVMVATITARGNDNSWTA